MLLSLEVAAVHCVLGEFGHLLAMPKVYVQNTVVICTLEVCCSFVLALFLCFFLIVLFAKCIAGRSMTDMLC